LNFVKMQWGTPYKRCTLRLILGEGFDRGFDMVEFGLEKNILKMASSSVQFRGKSIGNGKANAGNSLLTDTKLREEFCKEIDNVKQARNGPKI